MTRMARQWATIAVAAITGVVLAAAPGEARPAASARAARPAAAGASSTARTAAVAGTATAPTPTAKIKARRMRARPRAVKRGTLVTPSQLVGNRVFSDAHHGFALAGVDQAQYPARTVDGGQTWLIDGPQLHVDAADAPEAVSWVGVAGAKRLFAYGSSVVDVTTDGGRTWWEAFMGELVTAVVPGPGHKLLAYVEQSVSNANINPAVTWQYVSRDGGRTWHYSTALGGL
jgi:hypothetical protein